MELRHLQTFAAAAERQNFTRAAEQLSITQAAVSQHIAVLEREFRTALFSRAGRSVTLTDPGRQLYDYARRILDLVDEAAQSVGKTTPALQGTLRIATSTAPAESLVPDLLHAFRRRFPDLRESVTVSDSQAATHAVEEGTVELAFVGELPRSSRLTARPLADDELVLVVSPDHPLAQRKEISLSQLRTEPLIVREPGSGSRRCIEQALQAAGLSPSELTVVLETNSNDAIRGAVERGVGAAFLSRSIAARDIESGRLVALQVDHLRAARRLYLLIDPERFPTPPARAFLAFLDEQMADEAIRGKQSPK